MTLIGFGVSPPMVSGPSAFYRVHNVARLLSERGHAECVAGCRIGWPTDLPGPLALEPLGGDRLVLPDAVVLHYAALPVDTVQAVGKIEQARACGQRVYCDMDDDLWAVPSWNTFAEKVKRDAETARSLLPAFTAVLCSTPTLAAVAQEETGARTLHAPNIFDPRPYRKLRKRSIDHGPLTIGWHGLVRTSGGDLERLGRLMAPVLDAHPDWRFVHVGSEGPEDDDEFARYTGLDPERVDHRPGVPIVELPGALDFDIGLVVRQEGRFNRSRTETKGFELAAAGIPFVAVTDIPAYQHTQFVVDEDEFPIRLRAWADDAYRLSWGRTAREWADGLAQDNRAAWPVGEVCGVDAKRGASVL